MNYLIVFLGAGIGGAMRHGVNVAAMRLIGAGFPWGTLAVNIAGSFVMGLVAEYFALKSGLPQQWRLFLATGVLGGFTTFSAFSLEVALLYERGEVMAAGLYVLGSVALAVVGLFAGLYVIRALVAS
ncbi:fluoride efflux transporter CrcB [Ferrovibrio sp.]|uniref:fluoride efflux transporter CrcB n=1 Tax=Ferrovibrio sp. TaxID=1917215 RepID=UPI000CADA169|nr:fluoride efflux transporter CrcB [Ferrovibrio sp.]PJI44492.1 MAG: fluoride efflux transporter CrcB [Ferrovibrio sp.]